MFELLSPDDHKAKFSSYFGFKEMPFGVTPDPRFFYRNTLYEEGLSALVYGIQARKGLMLLTGEVGTGKTILLRTLIRHLETAVKFVFVSTSHLTSFGLVEVVVHNLGLTSKEKSRLEMIQDLNAHLLQQLQRGQTVALLIDEAQNLSDDALEGLCGLLNLETDEEKLLQIVLVGQPELAVKLTKPSLRRIKQRIAVHYRLRGLQAVDEVENYIRHRLQVAGYEGPDIFNKEAVEAVWYYSAGTPRLINMICDNALAMTYQASKKKVSPYVIMKAAGGLLLERGPELAKNGAPQSVVNRARSAVPKNHTKRTETNGIDFKPPDSSGTWSGARPREQPLEAPSASFDSSEWVSRKHRIKESEHSPRAPTLSQAAVVPSSVPAHFFDHMARRAVEAMGPMAELVLSDQIHALGESREAFAPVKLEKLIDLVSEEILNQTMREGFRRTMLQELATLRNS